MSWEDIVKKPVYYGSSNMEKAKKAKEKLQTIYDALKSGEFDETMKYAQNERNYIWEATENKPLQLSKEELIEAFTSLLIGVNGQIEMAGEEMAEDAGDRAFVSQFER